MASVAKIIIRSLFQGAIQIETVRVFYISFLPEIEEAFFSRHYERETKYLQINA
jgi:hypothetical protein